jgi:hypothetical protein
MLGCVIKREDVSSDLTTRKDLLRGVDRSYVRKTFSFSLQCLSQAFLAFCFLPFFLPRKHRMGVFVAYIIFGSKRAK